MFTLFKNTLFLCVILLTSAINAQSYSIKVIDEKSGEPVPYATVETGEHQGVITNEEGVFTLNLKRVQPQQDSIYISSMGYERKGLFMKSEIPSEIGLAPKTFALKSVFVSNNLLSPKEIIEKVVHHLAATEHYYRPQATAMLPHRDNVVHLQQIAH